MKPTLRKRRSDGGHRAAPKLASADLVPDDVWRQALLDDTAFIVHHIFCDVMRNRSCDCEPLFVGSGFGVDNVRASA